jgi:hypothetical protein
MLAAIDDLIAAQRGIASAEARNDIQASYAASGDAIDASQPGEKRGAEARSFRLCDGLHVDGLTTSSSLEATSSSLPRSPIVPRSPIRLGSRAEPKIGEKLGVVLMKAVCARFQRCAMRVNQRLEPDGHRGLAGSRRLLDQILTTASLLKAERRLTDGPLNPCL